MKTTMKMESSNVKDEPAMKGQRQRREPCTQREEWRSKSNLTEVMTMDRRNGDAGSQGL